MYYIQRDKNMEEEFSPFQECFPNLILNLMSTDPVLKPGTLLGMEETSIEAHWSITYRWSENIWLHPQINRVLQSMETVAKAKDVPWVLPEHKGEAIESSRGREGHVFFFFFFVSQAHTLWFFLSRSDVILKPGQRLMFPKSVVNRVLLMMWPLLKSHISSSTLAVLQV